jgi:TolB protein
MNSDGGKVRRLTYEGNYNTSPCWSPGGERIAYEGATNGCFQIFTIDKDGNNLLQLTFENGGCEYPSWSPDGRYLAFSAKGNDNGKICIINSNGLNLRVLYKRSGLEAIYPSWSPRLKLY